jgi:hypothetical protein
VERNALFFESLINTPQQSAVSLLFKMFCGAWASVRRLLSNTAIVRRTTPVRSIDLAGPRPSGLSNPLLNY